MKLTEVPILDCALIAGPLEGIENTDEFQEFTQKLGDGMSQIGFVYFINHGVDPTAIENMLAESRKFFHLPKDVKDKYKKLDPIEDFHGYSAADEEILTEGDKSKPEYKEAFDFWSVKAFDEAHYPKEVPGFKAAVDELRTPIEILTKKILRSFALYLKLDDLDFFINHHKHLDDKSVATHNDIRSNYYMPLLDENLEIGEDDMRLTAHNDWGTVTFLIQDDCGGLEAMKPDGEWINVPPIKDSIVFNAGIMLEMWSGGLFPATTHRVRLLKESAHKLRQSVGYFLQPDGDSHCVPVVPEKADWKPMYPKVEKETHFEYFKDRVRGSRAY